MKKLIALLALIAGGPLSAAAQQTGSIPYVKVNIVPTTMSWDYPVGEKIEFEVSILRGELPLTGVDFRWEAGPEMMPPVVSREANTGARGTVKIDAGRMSQPGFFTLGVSVEVDGRRYDQWKTVGVERDRIEPTVAMPDDFAAWWASQRALDDRIELRPEIRLLPDRCTSSVDVYEVSYAYTPRGGRMYGILCIPRAPGRYPAILRVPGAGVRPYAGQIALAERGYITLEVGIHGIPVTLAPDIYDDLRGGALTGYQSMNIESREAYYYNKVYRGCRRGVDLIFSLPQFDGTNIGVVGESQGGALAIVVGALDDRVKCVSSYYPALSDMTGYLHDRAGGWPHLLRNPEGNIYNTPEALATLSYYDAVNFARQLRVPIFFSMGYNDKTCPPTSTFSVYNSVTSPKELMLAHQTAHWRFPEQDAASQAFLDRYLKR